MPQTWFSEQGLLNTPKFGIPPWFFVFVLFCVCTVHCFFCFFNICLIFLISDFLHSKKKNPTPTCYYPFIEFHFIILFCLKCCSCCRYLYHSVCRDVTEQTLKSVNNVEYLTKMSLCDLISESKPKTCHPEKEEAEDKD